MTNSLRELLRQAYVQIRRSSQASRQRHGLVRTGLVQTGVALCEHLETRQLLAATGLQAFHRSGQTFITWNEDTGVTGEGFHVYRHSSPITSANLSQARKLTSKWGALDDQTSVHRLHGANSPENFVIQDLGAPLGADQGLFVYTTPSGESGTWYYAVTQVTNGVESLAVTSGVNSLASGITEAVAAPVPVLVYSVNEGKGRVYTQFMDYANWNPTFNGYAYNYSVALPYNYSSSTAWALKVMPHAYGERYRVEPESDFQWPAIQVFPDDPGGSVGAVSTWWYGFAADHNYKTEGPIPTSGRIANFTEQRVLRMIAEVQAIFNVDATQTHAQGNSMGASGALSWGMRYGNVFAGTFSSEPMTNYATSPLFQNDYEKLWGTQASNLPIVNGGPQAAHLTKYNGIGVYNWMNHHEQIVNRRGDDMAFLMFGHGKADDVIDWATQGKPFIAAVNAARVGFTAEQRENWDHNWMGFDFANAPMFSTTEGGLGGWIYQGDRSFPSFTYATKSGPEVPAATGTDFYNLRLDWSVPWNAFHTETVDTAERYEISLRSRDGVQTADVTPRHTQVWSTSPGTVVQWQNINNSTGAVIASGTVVADASGLVTIPQFSIGTDVGNRLILIKQVAAPNVNGPAAKTVNQQPTISWTAISGAGSYDLWVRNVSTNQNPLVNVNVSGTSWTPTSSLGIGVYRVWVRTRTLSGQVSSWSQPYTFQINTPVTVNDLPSVYETARPVISWNPLPGAVRYDLWVDNTSTGTFQVIRQTALTGTSFQPSTNLAPGNYTAWVRAIDAGGTAALWSVAEVFRVAPKAVVVSPLGPTFDTTPTFTWQSMTGAASYEVFVSNRSSGQTVLNITGITGTSWTPQTALGTADYRWWVRVRGVGGVYGTWSSPVDFNVSGKAVFQTTSGTTSDRTPTLTWTAVADADRYELWVSRLDGGGVVINETQLTGTSYTPLSNLVPRVYRAWVRAVSSSGQVGPWSASIDITVVDSDASRSIHVLGNLDGHLLTELPAPKEEPTNADAPSVDPGMPESADAIHGKTLDDVMSEVMSGVFFDTM